MLDVDKVLDVRSVCYKSQKVDRFIHFQKATVINPDLTKGQDTSLGSVRSDVSSKKIYRFVSVKCLTNKSEKVDR